MKIEGPRGPQGSTPVRKGGQVSSSDAAGFRGLIESPASVADPTAAAATQAIAQIDTLLAVQATEDPTERAARRRVVGRSGELLDSLNKIRIGMLSGTLTVGHMIDIADVVASHREKIHDPQLTSLLDEIDLRAQVEIAKMRLSLDDALGSAA